MLRKSISYLRRHSLAVAGAAAAGVMALPSLASAAVDTAVSGAFTGTGQNVLDTAMSVLPDVLIPFAAFLAIRWILGAYHKVR